MPLYPTLRAPTQTSSPAQSQRLSRTPGTGICPGRESDSESVPTEASWAVSSSKAWPTQGLFPNGSVHQASWGRHSQVEWCQPPGTRPVLANDAATRNQTTQRLPPETALPYSGDGAPEAFWAQFRTQARLLEIPLQLLSRPLIAKLTGDAWI